jgi:membrane-bound ClpP family serine protease
MMPMYIPTTWRYDMRSRLRDATEITLAVAAATLVIMGIVMLCATCAQAAPTPDWSRAVYIDGEIDDATLALGEKLLAYTAGGNTSPVTIIIDSPGGSVIPGLHFIDIIDRKSVV